MMGRYHVVILGLWSLGCFLIGSGLAIGPWPTVAGGLCLGLALELWKRESGRIRAGLRRLASMLGKPVRNDDERISAKESP